MNSTHRAYMPNLDALIAAQGMQLRNFVISTSTCCPSRLNLLTGSYTHNHNVTSNINPYGAHLSLELSRWCVCTHARACDGRLRALPACRAARLCKALV